MSLKKLTADAKRTHRSTVITMSFGFVIVALLTFLVTAKHLQDRHPTSGASGTPNQRANSLVNAGRLLMERNKPLDAVVAFEGAAMIESSASTLILLAEALIAADRPATAKSVAEQAVHLEPTNADAHFMLGRTRLRLNDVTGAHLSFSDALRLAEPVTRWQHRDQAKRHQQETAQPSNK